MSAESDFQAALEAHAPLVVLIGDRIALSAVPQGSAYPCVQYASRREPQRGLDNSLHATLINFDIQAWGSDADQASEVADEIEAALLAVDVVVTSRTTVFDPDQGVDGVQLAAEWWES